jgi:hypothetical protein
MEGRSRRAKTDATSPLSWPAQRLCSDASRKLLVAYRAAVRHFVDVRLQARHNGHKFHGILVASRADAAGTHYSVAAPATLSEHRCVGAARLWPAWARIETSSLLVSLPFRTKVHLCKRVPNTRTPPLSHGKAPDDFPSSAKKYPAEILNCRESSRRQSGRDQVLSLCRVCQPCRPDLRDRCRRCL